MENEYIVTPDGELYHYGVKGMKWGVRRDARILAKHRRNKLYKDARRAYDYGEITKEERKRRISAAKNVQKRTMKRIEDDFANAKTDSQRERARVNLAKTVTREVPYADIKRGAAVVNRVLHAMGQASIAGAVALSPATYVAPAAMLGTAAIGSAATAGEAYVRQLFIDKFN